MAEAIDVLEQARRDVGLSIADLWLRYFTLGGMSTALEVEAILYGALLANDHDRDVIAVALNERFAELGGDHPVPYTGDDERGSLTRLRTRLGHRPPRGTRRFVQGEGAGAGALISPDRARRTATRGPRDPTAARSSGGR